MGIDTKLETFARTAAVDSENMRIGGVAGLAVSTHEVLRAWLDHRGIDSGDRGNEDALQEMISAARLADAARTVAAALRSRTRAVDFSFRSIESTQEELRNYLSRRPHVGHVYVAWRQKPQAFLYVGRASSPDRLWSIEGTHGHLIKAHYEGATTLSIIPLEEPRQERAVEASVLEVVRHCTGNLPVLNQRVETVGHGFASDDLEVLGAYFRRVGRHLTSLADQICRVKAKPAGHQTK